jgi:hypothetical protein
VVCEGSSMNDNKFPTAESTTKQIENHTRRAVEVLSNRFNGQIRSGALLRQGLVLYPKRPH